MAFLDSAGQVTGRIPVDAHPESFQLEKSGSRVFVNVPDHREVEVADVVQHCVLTHWPVATCTDNFPMTLDETDHRLFVGCRTPPRLLVFDTETGKRVASYEGANSDDIFYDARKRRVYVLGRSVKSDAGGPAGPGFVEVFQEQDANHFRDIATYPTGPGAGTGFFVPEWGELFVAARRGDEQSAAILVYQTK